MQAGRNLNVRAVRPITPTVTEQPQSVDLNQQIDQVQGIALDNFQDSVRVVTEGNRNNASLLNSIAQNLAGAQEAQQLTESFSSVQRTGNAEAAINVVGQVADIFLNLQQQRQEARRQQALVDLEGNKQRFLAEAESIIRSPEQGRQAYDRMSRQFINRYSGVLDAEGIIDLTAELYEPYRTLSSEEARSTFGTFEQLYDQRTSSEIAGAEIRIAGQLARLANATTVEETQTITEETLATIDEQVQLIGQTNPRMALAVSTNMLSQITEQYGDRLGQLGEVTNRLNNLQQYYSSYTQNVTPLINQGQYDQAQQLEGLLAAQFNITGTDRQTDPLQSLQLQDRYRGYIDNQRQFQAAQYDEVISEAQFSTAAVRSLAFRIASDPSSVELLDPAFRENPYFRQAQVLAETFTRYRDNSSNLQLEQTRLQRSIDTLNRQSTQTILSNLERPPGQDEFLMSLGIAAQFDSGLSTILEQYQQARQVQNPEQRRELVQQILDSNANIVDSLQRELQVRQEQLTPDIQLLRQYDIYSVDDLEALANGDDSFLEEYQTTLREAQEARQSNLGAVPNFSLPGLSTTQLDSGAQAILPLMETTNPHRFTGQVGDDRGTHLHAGLDVAIANNEPIVFYTQGEVVRVQTDAEGYGLYVDVRSPDGHLHRFAHLNDAHVSVGQQVVPGEVLGLGGSTGRSTGPHLHWEIRRPGGSGFGYDPNTVMNPLDYTSQFQANARQPRVYNEPNNGGRSLERQYAPVSREDYGTNNPDHNFGYSALAEDTQFRNGLHRVSDNVGIPTMWLSDVIAFESNFRADAWNQGGAPAVGLIQFYADPGTGGRYGSKTIRGRTYQLQDIQRMSRVEQLRLVEDYLIENRPSDNYQSPFEVLAAVFGGPGLLRHLRRNPSTALSEGDGDITFGNYTRELGSAVGRQYDPIIPEPIRTR